MKPKLIRDKVSEILEKKGTPHHTHVAGLEEYRSFLDEKLLEEVREYLVSKEPEELADILEVIHALAMNQKISIEDIEKLRVKKKEERGGFSERIILDELN